MILAGASSRVMTPRGNEQVFQGGYAARTHCADGVHDDLFAKAICFENESLRVVLVALDVVGITREQFERIRAGIVDRCGTENVIVCATHAHSGPETHSKMRHINGPWCDRMVEEAILAAEEALQNRAPATLYGGFTHVPSVTKNRRGEDAVDDELFAMRVVGPDGKTRGSLVNYACHCTVLDASNYLISADYPGYLYQGLSSRYNDAVVMFTNAACGNLNIGYSADSSALGADMGDVRSYANASAQAADIQAGVEKIFASEAELDDRLSFHPFQYEMPLKADLPTPAAVLARMDALQAQLEAATDDAERTRLELQYVYETCMYDNVTEFETEGKQSIIADGAILRLGNVAFLTVPVELFCEIGLRLKAAYLPELRLVVLGYSNGDYGYLPTREAMEKGGYECETSVHSADGAGRLIDRATEMKVLLQ